MKNQLLENREALGKFRDNSKTTETGEDGYWEFFHLVGYAVFPSMNWGQGKITIDKNDVCACVVVYNDLMQSQKVILSFYELKQLNDYVDFSSLSEPDKSKISKDKLRFSRSEIERFLRDRLESHIYSCRTANTNIFCKKWPQRDKFLKTLKDLENNIDQLYILKTDFYEKP